MIATTTTIAEDLEDASLDNIETYDATGSAGISQPRCDACDRPLIVSAYASDYMGQLVPFACDGHE